MQLPANKKRCSRLYKSIAMRRCDRRHRPTMTIEDRTKLRNIAVRLQATLDELKELEKTTEDGGVKQAAHLRLQATLDELKELEKTTEDGGVKQAALSTEMALAWIDLVHQFAAERN